MLLFLFFVLVGIVAGYGFYYVFSHLRVSISPSAGFRIFWLKKNCEFVRGEYALVKPPPNDPHLISPSITLIKRFSCFPGEKVEKRGLRYFCYRTEGFVEEMATAKTRSRKGEPLEPWVPPRNPIVIPEGYYFMANPSKDSYDSRYLGLIPKERIIGCLLPLF